MKSNFVFPIILVGLFCGIANADRPIDDVTDTQWTRIIESCLDLGDKALNEMKAGGPENWVPGSLAISTSSGCRVSAIYTWPIGVMSTSTNWVVRGIGSKAGLLKAAGPIANLSISGHESDIDPSSAAILKAAQDLVRQEPNFVNADENEINRAIFERSLELEANK